MSRRPLSLAMLLFVAFLTLRASGARAEQADSIRTLDQLLEQVRRGWNAERAENRRRERAFQAARSDQHNLLERAKATLAREEARSEELEAKFEANELRLSQLEETLRERLGTLGELFGTVRQVAGDTRGHLVDSLVSAQISGREPFLAKLAQSKALPSIDLLEKLWFHLLEEMTESGRVVRFPATVVTVDGEEEEREVVRVGAFAVLSKGRYLQWLPEVGKLAELGRQPPARYLGTVDDFEAASEGLVPLAVDPSRGAILSLLVQTPGGVERIQQGGPIGLAIIVLGVLAGLLGLQRLAVVLHTNRRVRAQKKRSEVRRDNPLGRVLSVYEENRGVDTETLELKLDEAILRESGRLDRFMWAIKVVSVVAPLMGLLGTVTGMIQTFQAITLFGTGDPKLMAGGISEALVTTMLGLIVAIPLVLIHALVASRSKEVLEVLEEQSAGMVAMRAEQGDAVA
ncbi:MAG: MotA/TolQ/ExbB proton channel family protein [Myxococcota bacterium]